MGRLKPLTWDELADLYRQRTGGNARIKPMEEVAKWAETQPDVEVDKDDNICLKVKRLKVKP